MAFKQNIREFVFMKSFTDLRKLLDGGLILKFLECSVTGDFLIKIPGKFSVLMHLEEDFFQTEWSKTKSRRTVYPFWASVRRIKTNRLKNFEKNWNDWINARQFTLTVPLRVRRTWNILVGNRTHIIRNQCITSSYKYNL